MLIIENATFHAVTVRLRPSPVVDSCLAAELLSDDLTRDPATSGIGSAIRSWPARLGEAVKRLDVKQPGWQRAFLAGGIVCGRAGETASTETVEQAFEAARTDILTRMREGRQVRRGGRRADLQGDFIRALRLLAQVATFVETSRGDVVTAASKAVRRVESVRELASLSTSIYGDDENDRLIVACPGESVVTLDARGLETFEIIPCRFLEGAPVVIRAAGVVQVVVPAVRSVNRLQEDEVKARIRALGSEHGFSIVLQCLSSPSTAGEIARMLHLTPSQACRQLKRLESVGLLRVQRRGRFVSYYAHVDDWERLGGTLSAMPELAHMRAVERLGGIA